VTVVKVTSQSHNAAIRRDTITLDADGARQFDAFVAHPIQGRGLGILILTEMWGVTQAKLDLADAYARRGFCALVPNVFWRSNPSGVVADQGPERKVAWERLRAFDFTAAGDDLHKAVTWLRAHPSCIGKVAAIGFCAGGRLAFLAATRAKADAAIALYALGIAAHANEMANVTCPVQLHFGLADEHVPLSEIDAVTRDAAPYANIVIFRYPGIGHAFFNPTRPTYDAAAVALAEQRINQLFVTLSSGENREQESDS
jgi:carboxymethylenebutenolidase